MSKPLELKKATLDMILELKSFDLSLVQLPVILNSGEKVFDAEMFVKSHIAIMESDCDNRTKSPFFNRLSIFYDALPKKLKRKRNKSDKQANIKDSDTAADVPETNLVSNTEQQPEETIIEAEAKPDIDLPIDSDIIEFGDTLDREFILPQKDIIPETTNVVTTEEKPAEPKKQKTKKTQTKNDNPVQGSLF